MKVGNLMYQLKKSITNTIKYTYNKESHYAIHIGYGVDDNYARCLATSITSICLNNSQNIFIFHIMADNFTQLTKNKLKQLAEQLKITIIIYDVNTSYFKSLPTKKDLPISTYFRFLLPLFVKSQKLIYLDADILCLGNAKKLFNIKLDNNIIGAVKDTDNMNQTRNTALNLLNHTYFNAGMLVIDIEKWLSFDISNKAFYELIKNPLKYDFLDQDILNVILSKKIKYLPNIFNCIELNKISHKENIIFLHFTARPKPWHLAWSINKQCNNFNKNLYQNYESFTPFANFPLIPPQTYKEIEYYAKDLKRKKHYLKSLKWYLKYLYKKILK